MHQQYDKPIRTEMLIEKKFLDKVRSGEKKAEVRSWYDPDLTGRWIALREVESGKKEAMAYIEGVYKMADFPEEEMEDIFAELEIDQDFRNNYNCDYLYFIGKVLTIH